MARFGLVIVSYFVAGVFLSFGSMGIALAVLVFIPAVLVFWSAVLRRMHDFGWGGGYFALAFIPIVNWVILAMLFIRPGASGGNQHGSPPVGLSIDR